MLKRGVYLTILFLIVFSTLTYAKPTLIKPIEDITLEVYESKIKILDLKNHFKSNDIITYTVEGNTNITILISNEGIVSLITPNGWYGKENITFIASETKSNVVKIEIKPDTFTCEGECCGIDCKTTEKVCDNGIKSVCKNFCIEGKCIACSPMCYNDITKTANLPSLIGDTFIDTIPCINTTDKENKITKKQTNLVKNMVPEGYDIIRDPFSLKCSSKTTLTLNIPSDYYDIKTLRCEKGSCYPAELQYTNNLNCGEKITQNIREGDILKPEIMPIQINKTELTLKNNKITYEDINIEFYTYDQNIKAKISMPDEPIKEAANPSLKIITTPIILNLNSGAKTNIKITLPYVSSENIDENSIGFYIKESVIWKYFKAEINKEEKTATAYIEDIGKYANDNDITIALMGIICNDCFKSQFKKAYEPIQDSKDMIVLVHGLASRPETFQELIDDFKLTNKPYHIYTLGHSSYTPILNTSEELREYLKLESENYDNIYFVAHSMGGLITQQAIYNSYLENQKDQTKSKFINKVKKIILVSVPNEGTPMVKFYYELFDYLVNEDSPYAANELNSAIIDELKDGLITPQVPDIEYYVIAGTKTYPMVEKLSKLSGDIYNGEKNDGVVSVKSAQHIGNEYLNKICENYWEFNLSHAETIDEKRPIKVITSLISENKEYGLGNNEYYELNIENCGDDDIYMIIGKKKEQKSNYDLYCGYCGDGYCSSQEDLINCSNDCLIIKPRTILWVFIGFIVTIFIIFSTKEIYKKILTTKRKKHIIEQANILKMHVINNYTLNTKTGHTLDQLIKELINEGWHKEVIELFIKELNRSYGNVQLRFLKKNIKDNNFEYFSSN